jgi:hypothetical protein
MSASRVGCEGRSGSEGDGGPPFCMDGCGMPIMLACVA